MPLRITQILVILCWAFSPFSAFSSSLLPVTIHTGNQEHHFRLEQALTPESQEKGLMFRTSLPPDGGMIFRYDPPKPVYMWMRNTLIPLDMIFVRPDGTIAHIEKMAAPHSEIPRGTYQNIASVLELTGGTAEAQGIAPGDRVTYE